MFKLTAPENKERNNFHVTEIELNRKIFQDMRPQTTDPEKKLRMRKGGRLKPMTPTTDSPRKRPRSPKKKHQKTKKTEEITDPDILQLKYLAQRLPAANAELPDNLADKIAPILDRILCTVTAMGPELCIEKIDHPIVADLHQRLFALIDVDDFLTRVIVCRILLNFANDKTSPLLLPISRIFFKLSCEPANDVYFAEESLDAVLLTLISIGEAEVKVLAAGSLRNMTVSARMRERLVDSDLFAIGFDIFHDKSDNEELKIQIVGVFKRMCKEEKFRQKIAESRFLSMAANDKLVYCSVLRVAAHIPELSEEEKQDFLDAFARIEYSTEELIHSTLKALPVISKEVEDCDDCAKTINKLIKVVGPDLDSISLLIDIAMKINNSIEILHKDDAYVEILESTDYDSAIKSKVCELLTRFNDLSLQSLINKYSENV